MNLYFLSGKSGQGKKKKREKRQKSEGKRGQDEGPLSSSFHLIGSIIVSPSTLIQNDSAGWRERRQDV